MKNLRLLLLLNALLVTHTASAQQTLWPSQVTVQVEGQYRFIRSNGLPSHKTGQFPIHGNPNRITAQQNSFRVVAAPKKNERSTPLGMNSFGVAINGVPFDPSAAEWWNRDRRSGWQYEPMSGNYFMGTDSSNAHVQPTGAYHYHGLPWGLVNRLSGNAPKMVLIGWAADGFPIYGPWGSRHSTSFEKPKLLKSSFQIKAGTRPSGPGDRYDGTFVEDYQYVKGTGDLDENNGIFGPTPEFPNGIYHYHITNEFPFIPRSLKGTPDPSFSKRGPRPGGPGGRSQFRGRPGSEGRGQSRGRSTEGRPPRGGRRF